MRSVIVRHEDIDIDSVSLYAKNPRIGDVEGIRESLRENGQFQPIVIQNSTGQILSGNHTWKAAKAEGWTKINAVFIEVNDEDAKKVVLAANRLNDRASYSTDILADLLGSLTTPAVGTGYTSDDVSDLLRAVQSNDEELLQDIAKPVVPVNLPSLGEIKPEGDNSLGGPAVQTGEDGPVWTGNLNDTVGKVDDDPEHLDDELGQLQGLLQLREDMQFPGNNYYDIPDLHPDMLLDKLPDGLKTWGGHDATPDDGVSWWLWNYGVAGKKNLPMDRAILAFNTYDTYFDSFYDEPAYMTAKVLNAGIKIACVPDYSYYTDTGVATWVYNTYRAQWVGRYFQEAGIKVIPRIQYAIDKKDSHSLDFNTLGIPKNAPIVSKSSHNANSKEEFELEAYGLEKSLAKVQPGTLLIYGGNPALRLIERVKPVERGLCNKVVHLYNYSHVRRGVVFDKKDGQAALNRDLKRKSRDLAEEALAGAESTAEALQRLKERAKADREATKTAEAAEQKASEEAEATL